MKSVSITVGRIMMSLMILGGMILSPAMVAATNALPDTGWNFVATSNCMSTRTGISISTTYSDTPVVLENGQKDAGNGIKQYTYRCVEPSTYIVSWKPAVIDMTISGQPTIALFTTSVEGDQAFALQKQSLRHGLSYGSILSIKTVPNTVDKVDLSALSQDANVSYGFFWESAQNPIRSYTEETLSGGLSAVQEFSSSASTSLVLTDYYRGKYLIVYAVVRNNDGFSAIRNMPYEVDDVVPLALYIAPKTIVRPITTPTTTPPTVVPTPRTPNNPTAVNPSSCSPESTDDGSVTLCRGKVITHTPTTIRATVKKVNSRYALLRLENANKKTLVVRTGKVYTLRGDNGRTVRLRYTSEGREHTLTFGAVTPAPEKQAAPSTVSTIVRYSVGVNNYPDTKSYENLQNLSNAFVNMYTMRLDGDHFSVVSFETKSTGVNGDSAVFSVEPNQMVSFEGFKTHTKAIELGNEKKASVGGDVPPYKNWNSGKQELCQTNRLNINQKMQFSDGYSCSTSMSVPYQN